MKETKRKTFHLFVISFPAKIFLQNIIVFLCPLALMDGICNMNQMIIFLLPCSVTASSMDLFQRLTIRKEII